MVPGRNTSPNDTWILLAAAENNLVKELAKSFPNFIYVRIGCGQKAYTLRQQQYDSNSMIVAALSPTRAFTSIGILYFQEVNWYNFR